MTEPLDERGPASSESERQTIGLLADLLTEVRLLREELVRAAEACQQTGRETTAIEASSRRPPPEMPHTPASSATAGTTPSIRAVFKENMAVALISSTAGVVALCLVIYAFAR